MHLSLPPLQITNLAVVRGDRRLFANCNFTLKAGEIVHLTGKNGVGKTSLLETICGLRVAEAGKVQGVEPALLHWVGHKNALNMSLSPVENLQFWCGVHGANASAIVPALSKMQLNAARNRAVRLLSTGQKRRTALARLLLQNRPLWVLDEPLAGLDVEGVALFADMLRAHCDAGGAVILTSHQALPASAGAIREWALKP